MGKGFPWFLDPLLHRKTEDVCGMCVAAILGFVAAILRFLGGYTTISEQLHCVGLSWAVTIYKYAPL